MQEDVHRALTIHRGTPLEQRTIDITATGRRSGQPRRIEIVFYRFETPRRSGRMGGEQPSNTGRVP
jgi:hypothetical protein